MKTYQEVLPVLNQSIPSTGRSLTSREVKAIRSYGWPCSEKWEVFPAKGLPWYGEVLSPTGDTASFQVERHFGKKC